MAVNKDVCVCVFMLYFHAFGFFSRTPHRYNLSIERDGGDCGMSFDKKKNRSIKRNISYIDPIEPQRS